MWFKKDKNGKSKGGKNVYMLLDRSGSMTTSWVETLGSINGYVEKLEDDVNVYLAAFDSLDFTVIEESTARNWNKVTNEKVFPRASTPLYDSAAVVMDRMLADNPERAIFVVMTDGYENASKEYTLDAVKARLKSIEAKNWPAVFLGADFEKVTTYATGTFNISSSNVVNTTGATRGFAMNLMAAKTDCYFNEVNTAFSTAMNFTDAEKAALANNSTKTTTTTTTTTSSKQ